MSDMPVTPSDSPEPSNKNRNIIIGVVAAIVLCCCCVLGSGILYYVWNNY